MAAPVINTTQSVLGYLQWQAFAFQPWASNSPTRAWRRSLSRVEFMIVRSICGDPTWAVCSPRNPQEHYIAPRLHRHRP